MRGEVVGPQVRLDFDDAPDALHAMRHVHEAVGSRDKRFLEFGRASGCKEDYGHIDLILGKRAKDEVWPHIRAWIEVH